jgi:hypothetical protein
MFGAATCLGELSSVVLALLCRRTGNLDLDTCAPYTLIHVRRVAKADLIPPPCI